MTTSDSSVINLGQAVRDGLRLKTIDVVALLHDACLQLEIDGAKKLPTSIDELSINDAGSVVMPSGRPFPTLRTAVATLLDALLATISDEADSVPPALRSLPERLRAAGNAARSSDIKDLLTILRWHIPHDPRQVLRELAIRAQLAGLREAETAAIEAFPDEAPAALVEPRAKMDRRSWPLAWAAALAGVMLSGYAAYLLNDRGRPAADEPASAKQVAIAETPAVPVATPATPEATAAAATPAAPEATPGDASSTATPAPDAATPRIVVRNQQPLAGDAPRPLPLSVNGGAFSPSFAEGARTLLFHAGHNTSGRLFSASLDEHRRPASVTPLLDDRGRMYHVRLSPDGRSLAFDSDRDGERAVYIADRTGSRFERVSGDGYAAVPSWAPDMKTITFVRAEPDRPRVWNLWQRDLASGNMTRLTQYRSGQVWGASWFPDSQRYAYSHDDRLIVADRAGRDIASFKSPIARRLVRTPAVSPDGTRIIFQVYRDGVWLLDVASGEMRKVLDDATAEEFAWDSDGKTVAYHSRRDGQWRIWVMPV